MSEKPNDPFSDMGDLFELLFGQKSATHIRGASKILAGVKDLSDFFTSDTQTTVVKNREVSPEAPVNKPEPMATEKQEPAAKAPIERPKMKMADDLVFTSQQSDADKVGKVVINGVEHSVTGSPDIVIVGNTAIINGTSFEISPQDGVAQVSVEGTTIRNLVVVKGNVSANRVDRNLHVIGDASVGAVGGNSTVSGDMSSRAIGGSATVSGDLRSGDIGGSATVAGDATITGNVRGSLTVMGDLKQ